MHDQDTTVALGESDIEAEYRRVFRELTDVRLDLIRRGVMKPLGQDARRSSRALLAAVAACGRRTAASPSISPRRGFQAARERMSASP